MKTLLACMAIMIGSCLIAQEKPIPDQSAVIQIAKLQRDLARIQAQAAQLQTQLLQLQASYETKNAELQKMVKDVGCKLDLEKLECTRDMEKK